MQVPQVCVTLAFSIWKQGGRFGQNGRTKVPTAYAVAVVSQKPESWAQKIIIGPDDRPVSKRGWNASQLKRKVANNKDG